MYGKGPKRKVCLDPDKMHGAGDQFPGSDEGSHYMATRQGMPEFFEALDRKRAEQGRSSEPYGDIEQTAILVTREEMKALGQMCFDDFVHRVEADLRGAGFDIGNFDVNLF